ncbi:helix-turn-helix transcriptional regulator [Amycolatopsis samaneae]|uniref:LuxR C-terminal-related transcriptional regulator n=1 Tax=Amycolatopsis samaneae TaxID=664691 RepID=A0ABW5GLB2_9PSEU
MGRQRAGLVGRQAELAALGAAAESRGLVVLRGEPGSGRGAVLARAGAELARRGVFVLELSGAARHPEWDRFGVRIVLDAIRERFEDLGGRARLTEAIDALSRLCVPAGYESAWERSRLVNALGTVFRRLGPAAVLVDDADGLAQPAIGLAAARHAGCPVFAACADDTGLGEVADLTIELGALSAEDADGVLRQAVGLPVDDGLRRAVREGLGALYGNPGTVVSTVADLRRRGRLVTVHGHVCLRDPGTPVALSPEHPLLVALERCGDLGRDLVRLAGDTAFGVDEIPLLAAATGRSTAEYGRAADRLVRAGVLDADGEGRLSVRCPALGAAVAEHGSAPLHEAVAGELLDADGARPHVLARHLAAAGTAVPRRPEVAAGLRDGAPDTARWYAAWWHTEDGEDRSRAAVELVRRFVRTADYARLARFVGEVPAGELDPADLAAAAALAALHSGRPVPASVRAAVTRDGRVPAALEFCDRWFAGAGDLTIGEVETAFAPLRSSLALPTIERRTVGVEHAFALRDLVPVLASVLGADFGTPADGPLAAYHRVLAGYADGDWTAALSAARELELDPHADTLARQSARLHAAEMCSWRGEDQRAAAWLDSVPAADCAFPALWSWVVAGWLHQTGNSAGALSAGERAAGGPGTARLLRRMAAIAMESGEVMRARRVLAETERTYARDDSPEARETVSYVKGLVTGDGARARTAERLVRGGGNRFELSLACQLVGSTTAEPAPWLAEAFEIAQSIGAARLTARVKRVFQGSGGVVQEQRDRDEDLSETELRIIELIRLGRTNRQIAHAVRMSEKTVAKHLTRLFAKAGCRTRHGLATSDLGGRPQPLGA